MNINASSRARCHVLLVTCLALPWWGIGLAEATMTGSRTGGLDNPFDFLCTSTAVDDRCRPAAAGAGASGGMGAAGTAATQFHLDAAPTMAGPLSIAIDLEPPRTVSSRAVPARDRGSRWSTDFGPEPEDIIIPDFQETDAVDDLQRTGFDWARTWPLTGDPLLTGDRAFPTDAPIIRSPHIPY